ncbi:hypothetical protein KL921_000250 [Ogataea angusta]|uniref:Sphingoid long-chain base transporter RSB1 n=1 Tax=Pichia angusta TaxID=870730 RepID=A0AAN6I7K5_PICAN|nr:uncharacterized protein KL928_000541 [Ogataea angusta]KAG7813976.1 hypothetical protein KL921_000250 [Ogataea angusta]KAG7822066.1 hypothetical protein KL928_000541 [Ogataea angusta]KAG7837357.1 hypothetical protein KL943_001396 [Ogataea angusta]KAG7842194.1 hypothetical protein KL942_000932 [Ogataea angusta]KAG7852011.1 hypothetical protein KL940_000893 [Ogataea angusta]
MSSGYAYLIEHINLGSNCFLTAYFGLLLAAHLFLLSYTHLVHFGYAWCLAMAGEIVGYIGRIMISKSSNKTTAIIMDSVGLNAGASLMIAGLYVAAARVLKQRATNIGRTSPGLLRVVLGINIASIALYSAGVAIEPNGGSHYQTGKDLAIAGTVIQLALLIAFSANWLFSWRSNHRDFCPAGQTLYYNSFPAAITLGMVLMVVRCCYRVALQAEGSTGKLFTHPIYVGILDSLMAAITALIMTVFHPGLVERYGVKRMSPEESYY